MFQMDVSHTEMCLASGYKQTRYRFRPLIHAAHTHARSLLTARAEALKNNVKGIQVVSVGCQTQSLSWALGKSCCFLGLESVTESL